MTATPLYNPAQAATINQGFRVSPSEKANIDCLKMSYGLRVGRIVDTRELMMAALAELAERLGCNPPG